MFPDLAHDQAVMASLRGQLGTTRIFSLSEKYEGAAPLIAEIYELLDLERRSRLTPTNRR
jgi:hypothetical protein